MIVSIPIRPANLRFLQVKYNFKELYVISRQHAIDHLLQELMRPKPRTYKPIATGDLPVLQVQIGKDKSYAHLLHITDESISAINQFIDELIKAEVVAHVFALTEYAGLEINESIYHFIEKYQFTENEITFDALKKYYYRHQKKMDVLPSH